MVSISESDIQYVRVNKHVFPFLFLLKYLLRRDTYAYTTEQKYKLERKCKLWFQPKLLILMPSSRSIGGGIALGGF